MMTIEQTVEIPADHRIFLDLPLALPVGKAKVTVTPESEAPQRPLSAREAIEKCRGILKGSGLSSDLSLEWRREEKALEEAKYRKLYGNDGGSH